ncbi:MAG: hypothetical protein QOJ74_1586, partial [Ilumatobacteraceae bacterium]|nr:hypothetical protein [Ilumatobacteraceae bacterium]
MTARGGFVTLLGLVGLVGTSLLVLQPQPVDAALSDLRLIAQGFNIAADGTFTATLAMPATLSTSDLSTAEVVVTMYQRVEKREDLRPIIDGELVRPGDSVTISPGCCAGSQPGEFTVSVPLETSEVRPDALSIPRAGLYPVTIAVQRNGGIVSSVLSFVNRLPAADESADTDPISVGVAIGTHSSAHLDSNATISLDTTTNDEMTRLADALEALNANKFAATVRIAPAVLNGLQQLNPTVFSRLITSLQTNQVVAEPQWPIDPAAAAIAKQDVLYTSWRRAGQDQFAGLGLGRAVVSTSTILVDQPIGAEGAALRFRDGAGLMVVSPEVYDHLAGTIQVFSDNKGELVEADLADDVTLDVGVVDHAISRLLAHPLPTVEQTRIYAVADLLALRQKTENEGASLQRHAVIIGAPNLDVPDAQLLGSITALIATTPGL